MAKKMKYKHLYLDVCTYCRPFDNQDFMRIRVETDAFYLIISGVETHQYELVISPVHFKEIASISQVYERYELESLLQKFQKKLIYDKVTVRGRVVVTPLEFVNEEDLK